MKTSALGALAALGSSATWAYSSTRYAVVSREVSPVRVNLARMIVAWPVFVLCGLGTGTLGAPHAGNLSWLLLSTLCSYALADSLFFAAARRIGVASALSIASSYPLWAALKGTVFDGEPFGLARAAGTLFCVGGVGALVRMSKAGEAGPKTRDQWGVPLALLTSVLWAGNTIAIKAGSTGLSLWTVNTVRYGAALALLAFQVRRGMAPGPTRPAKGWTALVPAIIVDCLVGSALFVYGLRSTDLAVGATLSSLAPLLSLPFAVWMREERLTAAKVAAVCATVMGIALVSG